MASVNNAKDVWSSPGAFGHIKPGTKLPGETRAERSIEVSPHSPGLSGQDVMIWNLAFSQGILPRPPLLQLSPAVHC